MLNGKRVLVTGGAGFIGSHLCERLVREGSDVVILDDFSTGKESNLRNLKGNVEIVKATVEDYDSVLKAAMDCEFVIHEAFPYGKSGMGLEEQYIESGILGTFNVLKAAVVSGIKKVINASSVAVYGVSKSPVVRESQALDPLLPYGVTKLAGELYCRTFSKIYGLGTTSLRYFYVYGPRYASFDHSAMVNFLKRAVEGSPLIVRGDGSQVRDYTFIDDVVDGTLLAIEKSRGVGEAYNISFGEGTGIMDLARNVSNAVEKITGKRVETRLAKEGDYRFSDKFCRIPIGMTRKSGNSWVDERNYVGDISRARKDLGYSPKVDISEGISRTVGWLVSGGV